MLLWLLLILVPMLLGFWAQMRVMGTYKRWVQVPSRSRITGREAAAYVMRSAGIDDVEIVEVPGQLSDHYDPMNKRLALSHDNYHGVSLAALGVAAHEAGHAIQHKVGYAAMQLRQTMVPAVGFASCILPFVILGGFFFQMTGLIWLGVIAYAILTVFQLVTLPVEFDASARAKTQLAGLGIIYPEERRGVSDTLDAAAWTYVAAFVATLGNLLYLLLQLMGSRSEE